MVATAVPQARALKYSLVRLDLVDAKSNAPDSRALYLYLYIGVGCFVVSISNPIVYMDFWIKDKKSFF